MKKIFEKVLAISLFGIIFFLNMQSTVIAVEEKKFNYKIKENIPGQEGSADVGEEGIDTLQEYLEAVYKFGITIVAILAVVMVAIGAFMYIVTSAGNAGKMMEAKSIISNALFGLVIALISWLILFVINPDLVEIP